MASNQQIIRRSRPYPIERRPPQLLRDLLRQDSFNSCSSSGFKSLPRFPSPHLLQPRRTPSNKKLPPPQQQPSSSLKRSRSRSQAAADATLSLLHKLLKAVTPLNLPSSTSRRRVESRDKNKSEKKKDNVVRVRVKDILRWKSFRDLIVDGQDEQLLQVCEEGESHTTFDTSVLTDRMAPAVESISTVHCSGLAAEEQAEEVELTHFVSESESGISSGKQAAGTEPSLLKSHELDPINDIEDDEDDEDDHGSPISILDSPFNFRDNNDDYEEEEEEENDSFTSFDQTLMNVERTKQRLLENLKWFESIAAGVVTDNSSNNEFMMQDDVEIRQQVLSSSSSIDHDNRNINHPSTSNEHTLIAPSTNNNDKINHCRAPISRMCKSYDMLSRECVTEMQREGEYVVEEEGELGIEIEVVMLNELLDDLLFQLVIE